MKLTVAALLTSLGEHVLYVMQVFLDLFRSSPDLQLLVVMVVVPCCMNALQFLVTDSLIKKRADNLGASLATFRSENPSVVAATFRSENPLREPLPVPAVQPSRDSVV